jgi:5-formyltetrahydrofolate cyclo-ligase
MADQDNADQDGSVAARKAELRSEAVARRDALPPAKRRIAAEAIAARGLPEDLAAAAGADATVSGYTPLKSEINPLPLMRLLADNGAALALPVVVGRGQPLVMRAWSFHAPLKAGVWGISEPLDDADEVFPDMLIVPLLAFDRHGRRIGYGAGYYDITIAQLRGMKPVVAIGIAFAAQEVESVPVTARDARLDLVLTEREIIDFRT